KLLARYTTDGKESLQKSFLFRAFCKKDWSGREDSNLRPLGPKPSALPGCATPRVLMTNHASPKKRRYILASGGITGQVSQEFTCFLQRTISLTNLILDF